MSKINNFVSSVPFAVGLVFNYLAQKMFSCSVFLHKKLKTKTGLKLIQIQKLLSQNVLDGSVSNKKSSKFADIVKS